jgi:hypothetical protein
MAAILPFVGIAASVASTAISGISQFQQSQYQAAVAKNNAQIAKENSERASYASQIEQMRSDRQYMAEGSTLLATQAASGLDVLGKSQSLARGNLTRVRGEQAIDIAQEGFYNVRNFQQQQANFLGEARAAKTQAWMGLAATAFDIGGQVATFASKGGFKKKSLIGATG